MELLISPMGCSFWFELDLADPGGRPAVKIIELLVGKLG